MEKKLVNKGKEFIVYAYDLPILQNWWKVGEDKKAYEYEKQFFELSSAIMVFNRNCRRYLVEILGIDDGKIVEFEILDEYSDFKPPSEKPLNTQPEVVWIGNLSRDYVGYFIEKIKCSRVIFKFYGIGGEWLMELNMPNARYCGYYQKDELLLKISSSDFGLLTYSEKMLAYFKYSSSSKFSNYMVAGLPVLVNEKAEYPAELVGKYDVGIVYEDEKEIPQVVESVSKEEYELLS